MGENEPRRRDAVVPAAVIVNADPIERLTASATPTVAVYGCYGDTDEFGVFRGDGSYQGYHLDYLRFSKPGKVRFILRVESDHEL